MSEHVLICGVNWLGDAVMSMPALQCFRQNRPDVCISLAVRSRWHPLWRLHGAVDAVVEFPERTTDMWRAARAVAAQHVDRAVILPNSFRSAFFPFMAGIAQRRGTPGQLRSLLLTDRYRPGDDDQNRRHQAWEYMRLLEVDPLPETVPLPQLSIDPDWADAVLDEPVGDGWIGVLPGAARGPSKRWPAERFAEVAAMVSRRHGLRVMVLGTLAEAELCREVAAGIGPGAVALGGRTSIPVLAALLARCKLVLCNDSGGMHLASAVGACVVAVFGLTDPDVTGPIGRQHRVIRADMAGASRNIPRQSSAAEAALCSITTDEVLAAAESILCQGAE